MIKILQSLVISWLFISVIALPLQPKNDVGEYGEYFEGDMILTEEQIEDLYSPARNGIISTKYRWPNKTAIPYRLTHLHSKEQRDYIELALRKIDSVSCLKFVRQTNEEAYIEVTAKDTGCSSLVGYKGYIQTLNLQSNDIEKSCFRQGTIIHEFLHGLDDDDAHDSMNNGCPSIELNGSVVNTLSKLNDSVISRTTAEDLSGTNIMSMPIIFGDMSPIRNDLSAVDRSLNWTFFNQFSAQNLKLIEAGYKNGEKTEEMSVVSDLIRSDGPDKVTKGSYNVNVIEMKQNGNCLFAALVHQLMFVKCHSSQHDTSIAELRIQVVEHIGKNLEKYRRAILNRTDFEYANDTNFSKFLTGLNTNGINKKHWGGTETVHSVMDLYRVNIIIFNENGPFYYANGFNALFERTIFLAYRIGYVNEYKEDIYNHYDSIQSLDEDLLYECAHRLAMKMQR